jgi:hypothetical protein
MKSTLSEEQIHFQHDNTSLRLGHIASNLGRLRTFCCNNYEQGVLGVIDQTLYFIEWTAAEIEPEMAEELVNIQVQLALWLRIWDNIWLDDKKREEIATMANTWSERVLDMSGLLLEPAT